MLKYNSGIGSHTGMVRSNNQDSGFAGARLYFVADGMGGHAGGDVASALTAKYVAKIDGSDFTTATEAAKALKQQLLDANQMLVKTVSERPELSGMGTTFSGFFTVGNEIGIAHIGDSRIYRFRGQELTQITADHTFVQKLVDSGQITEEEAKTHPRRSVLMRVLGDVDASPKIDVAVEETVPGDVWLLCSDGLAGYVEEKVIRAELRKRKPLQDTVDQLIERALENGAPDNVTVVLVQPTEQADEVRTKGTDTLTLPMQRFAGSAAIAAGHPQREPNLNPRRFGRRRKAVPEAHFEPRVDEYLAELIAETKRLNWRRRFIWALSGLTAILLLVLAGFFAYEWSQTRYFVGTDGDSVIIYQGVQQNIGPIVLHSVAEDTQIPIETLDKFKQRQIYRTISAGSLEDARDIVLRLGDGDNG